MALRAGVARYCERWWLPQGCMILAFLSYLLLPPLLGWSMSVISARTGAVWFINPYVTDAVIRLLLIAVIATLSGWGISIMLWLYRRQWRRAITQAVLIVPVTGLLALAGVVTIIATMEYWPLSPLAGVFSPRHSRYYLVAQPVVNLQWQDPDNPHQIISAPRLWWPVWKREFAEGLDFDYVANGLQESFTLILSRDERMLVIQRNQHKTAATDLDNHLIIESFDPTRPLHRYPVVDRDRLLAERTARIDRLLASAGEQADAQRN